MVLSLASSARPSRKYITRTTQRPCLESVELDTRSVLNHQIGCSDAGVVSLPFLVDADVYLFREIDAVNITLSPLSNSAAYSWSILPQLDVARPLGSALLHGDSDEYIELPMLEAPTLPESVVFDPTLSSFLNNVDFLESAPFQIDGTNAFETTSFHDVGCEFSGVPLFDESDTFSLNASTFLNDTASLLSAPAQLGTTNQLDLFQPIVPAPYGFVNMTSVAPEARVACDFEGCTKTFRRVGDCRRHKRKHEAPKLRCTVLNCDMRFTRMDKVRDHLCQGHGIKL